MDSYQESLQEENKYLYNTSSFIQKELDKEIDALARRKEELLEVRKEMWENTVHFSNDFERLTEISQHLSVLSNQSESYKSVYKQIEKYRKMLESPYFGRFDFVEEASREKEKIYIGFNNLIDPESFDIIVYDWRSPISSIFYQHELGKASYRSPTGIVTGDVLLKRQYQIENGRLKNFFDCSIKIDDEILQEVLCSNSSHKMKNIVETIQKEQNTVIRDINNELLIVQGVAGSGKTSIALHRIAFLLYNGMNSRLTSNNILIISPNAVFSKYISDVLPELGEENVADITFDEIIDRFIGDRLDTEKKIQQLEDLILDKNPQIMKIRKSSIAFKESRIFVQILNRLIDYYERHMVEFQDIYYDSMIIETKELLKDRFLNDKIGRPMTKRLKRIESSIFNKIHSLRKDRIKKIRRLVENMSEHQFQIKSVSRLLSIRESMTLRRQIRKFTEVDYLHVYRILFNNEELFFKLAQGLELPENIKQIIEMTKNNLEKGYAYYEDCSALMFLKLKIEGSDLFSEIKQVVIDEAQDYSPMQYEVFNLLFKEGKFTILGDINQSIDKNVNEALYDDIVEILNRKKAMKVFLNKGYRSSYEINGFSNRILNLKQNVISFERHEKKPLIIQKNKAGSIEKDIVDNVKAFEKEGYGSIAIICKTAKEAEEVYTRLKKLMNIKLIDSEDKEIENGVVIIPSYLAKGLEFDVALVYNVSNENYSNEFDRKLLYVTCTRALHRLVLYHIGKISSFVPEH